MTFDVFASGFHRLCGPVELTAVHLKNVPEAVVYLQAGFYILTVRRFGQPLGIIQQNLLGLAYVAYISSQAYGVDNVLLYFS